MGTGALERDLFAVAERRRVARGTGLLTAAGMVAAAGAADDDVCDGATATSVAALGEPA